jgi:hypothetical protein
VSQAVSPSLVPSKKAYFSAVFSSISGSMVVGTVFAIDAVNSKELFCFHERIP